MFHVCMEDAPVHLRALSALVVWCAWAAPNQGVLCGARKGVGFHVAHGRFAGTPGQRGPEGFPVYGEGAALVGRWYAASGGKLCGGGGGQEAFEGGKRGEQGGQWERVRFREDVVL